MQKRHKDLMRTLVTELRHILVGTVAPDGTVLRGDLDRELERLGIAPDGIITALDALANATHSERLAHRIAAAQLELVAQAQRANTRMEIVERAAYSWINRLLALRAMETRGLIDETLRTNPDYDGLPEALFILRQSDPGRASGADGGRWAVLENACQAQARPLPGLFALDDPATALRPSTPALIRCMALVGGAMPGFILAESDAAFADPDAIGWAYQFYQEEAKARIYVKLGSGGKAVTRSEIAAATELFTEPYMVKWLLQNSLGRSYNEIHPDSTLPASWEYYIKPDTLDTSTTFNLASLTVLDPCMGSGHFLREAFDMFVAMYQEQFHTLSATEIADRILSHHLFGIDLDPRAAQLSALTLYLRAWELVRDERRKERKPGPGTYTPPAMNLATTPTSLNEGVLQRHLLRHPQDMQLKPLLEGIFLGLEHADILGSLIRPKEYLDNAIAELQRPHTIRMDFDPEEAELRRTITAMANHDPVGLRQMLLDRVADSFKSEAGNTDDVSAALFGREAEQGVRLLQLLDRRYAVVVTNPPYMGNKNMDTPLKKYIEKHYPSGKRDLYAAFILRCIELCRLNGRVAMVTQQSWMFLRSFAELRALPEGKLGESYKKGMFSGLLRETSIEALAHLGPNAFEEIGGEVVKNVMFTIMNSLPKSMHRIVTLRLIGLKSPEEKKTALIQMARNKIVRSVKYPKENLFLTIDQAPIVYWIGDKFFALLSSENQLSKLVVVKQGLATTNDARYLRQAWEILEEGGHWFPFPKGGKYRRWIGNETYKVDWQYEGSRIKENIINRYPYLNGKWEWVAKNSNYYLKSGLTYTAMASGSLALRIMPERSICGHKGPGVFGTELNLKLAAAICNSHVATYLMRILCSSMGFETGQVEKLPIPIIQLRSTVIALVFNLKEKWIGNDIVETRFTVREHISAIQEKGGLYIEMLLCCCEGYLEKLITIAYGIDKNELDEVLLDTGIPAGWYPLIMGYDALPTIPANYDLPSLPQELLDYLASHERITLTDKELSHIKDSLRMLYEAGPGAKNIEQEETDEASEDNGGEEDTTSGAHIPIPTETFLEELSVKMQLHPISVYWLLEELKAEGARCKAEELRILEDRLSVIILRLLGYRWPKQLEVGEPA